MLGHMFVLVHAKKLLSLTTRKTPELREACNHLIAEADVQLKKNPPSPNDSDDQPSRYALTRLAPHMPPCVQHTMPLMFCLR